MGVPRLSDQSDRVFILGVETSSRCARVFGLSVSDDRRQTPDAGPKTALTGSECLFEFFLRIHVNDGVAFSSVFLKLMWLRRNGKPHMKPDMCASGAVCSAPATMNSPASWRQRS